MATSEKIRKIDDEIKKAIERAAEDEKEATGKLSPEEAARIQSMDLPSGDPALTPTEESTRHRRSREKEKGS